MKTAPASLTLAFCSNAVAELLYLVDVSTTARSYHNIVNLLVLGITTVTSSVAAMAIQIGMLQSYDGLRARPWPALALAFRSTGQIMLILARYTVLFLVTAAVLALLAYLPCLLFPTKIVEVVLIVIGGLAIVIDAAGNGFACSVSLVVLAAEHRMTFGWLRSGFRRSEAPGDERAALLGLGFWFCMTAFEWGLYEALKYYIKDTVVASSCTIVPDMFAGTYFAAVMIEYYRTVLAPATGADLLVAARRLQVQAP